VRKEISLHNAYSDRAKQNHSEDISLDRFRNTLEARSRQNTRKTRDVLIPQRNLSCSIDSCKNAGEYPVGLRVIDKGLIFFARRPLLNEILLKRKVVLSRSLRILEPGPYASMHDWKDWSITLQLLCIGTRSSLVTFPRVSLIPGR
jgi:hypothetical protein